MTSAVMAQLAEDEMCATVNVAINFIDSAASGEVRVRRAGRAQDAPHRRDRVRDPPRGPPAGDRDRQLRDQARADGTFAACVIPAARSSPAIRSRSTNFWIFVPDIGHSSTKRT